MTLFSLSSLVPAAWSAAVRKKISVLVAEGKMFSTLVVVVASAWGVVDVEDEDAFEVATEVVAFVLVGAVGRLLVCSGPTAL